jgi:hypothetical protein
MYAFPKELLRGRAWISEDGALRGRINLRRYKFDISLFRSKPMTCLRMAQANCRVGAMNRARAVRACA